MLEIFLEFVMVRTGEVGSEKGGLLFERGSEDGLRSSREHDCWLSPFSRNVCPRSDGLFGKGSHSKHTTVCYCFEEAWTQGLVRNLGRIT
jgi:hypothetical protein